MANRPAAHANPAARKLILRVWHVDPLRCPICQSPMRFLAVVDNPRVVEKILRYLGAWQAPPPRPPPPDGSGPCTYEPSEDVEPDYENVLIDLSPLFSRPV